ncbi:MAG: hypothetical protein IPL42_07530 [Saprospiraceae bacterium]|nr:hypothetical protein [Saprospiraceae bacterium]
MRYLKFIVFLFILGACSKPEENFIKIPSEFTVALQEQIQIDGNRILNLEFASLVNNYCPEDTMIYNSRVDSSQFRIQILDSYKANLCIHRKNYLKSIIPLPDIKDSLDVIISLGNASTINMRVYIHPKSYRLELIHGTGLTKKFDETKRLPKNIIWGYAYPKSTDPTSETLLNNFRKDIEFDCSTNRLEPGYYSYLTVQNNYSIILSDNPGIVGNSFNFYYFHYKSDVELVDFFTKISSTYSNLIGYKINSGSGKEFKSL